MQPSIPWSCTFVFVTENMAIMHSLKYTVLFSFVLPLAVTRFHLLSFVATRCHSLSLVEPLIATPCHPMYHSSVFLSTIFWKQITFFKINTDVLVETHNRSKTEKRIEIDIKNENIHCVESVQIRSFFWSAFSRIRAEYGEIRSISVIRTRKNSVFWHFSCSDGFKSRITAMASVLPILKRSHRRCSVRKISQNSKENTCARVSF